jgi:hypothetical protein
MKNRKIKLPFSNKQKGGSFKILPNSDNMVSIVKSMIFTNNNSNNNNNNNSNNLNKLNFVKASETKEYYKKLSKK